MTCLLFGRPKFILFRVVDSISFPFLKDFPPYNHTQCHRGMVSKMATPTANILHLFLLLPLHFGLPFVLPALGPQAIQSRQPLLRSMPFAEHQPAAIPPPPQPSSPAIMPHTPTPQGAAEQEEDDPDARPVRRGVDARASRARQRMASQYEKRGAGTLPKRPMLVQAKGRRSPVVVQATVKQHAAYATRTGSGVQSTVIGALGSVLTRQQGHNIPRLRSYSNRTMMRWRNRILGVVNCVYSVSLVVARSLLVSNLTVKSTHKSHSPWLHHVTTRLLHY